MLHRHLFSLLSQRLQCSDSSFVVARAIQRISRPCVEEIVVTGYFVFRVRGRARLDYIFVARLPLRPQSLGASRLATTPPTNLPFCVHVVPSQVEDLGGLL